MAQFPILPFYTDAYLGDTTHLTTTEHGAYFLLLLTAWRSPICSLPDDDIILARYTKLTLDKWRKIRPILEKFYEIKDGSWWQNKLLATHEQVSKRSKSQSDSANAKWRKTKQNGHAMALPTRCQTDAIQIQTNIQIKDQIRSDENEEEKIGKLVSNLAIRKASSLAKQRGFSGGDELGAQLEECFLDWIKEEPLRPDAAFLAWVPGYLKNCNP